MTATAGPAGTVRIRRAGVDDIPRLARMLVDAFVDTPDARWLIRDRARRRDVYQRLCPGLLAQAMTAGIVYTTVDLAAAALWLPYPVAHTTTDRQTARLRRLTGRHADRFLQLAALLHTHAPRQPHTYLAYLGVAPHRQRNGIGGALLRQRHRICDTAGIASYLVATSPAARDLYLRHGYRPTTRHPLALPDNGPPLWPMWRQPHPTSPTTGGAAR
ncbi:GNAT family N-acetyltransferase [Micromonospora sp. LOL_013]|uniref:GNAT family N-acetyltransferase n=1 Tax=Micromonospora sp. LOL_013 TaxID=3345414 RepID=UPI003A8A4922